MPTKLLALFLLFLLFLLNGCATTPSTATREEPNGTKVTTTITRWECGMFIRAHNLDYIVDTNGFPAVKVTGLDQGVSPETSKIIESIIKGAITGAAAVAKP